MSIVEIVSMEGKSVDNAVRKLAGAGHKIPLYRFGGTNPLMPTKATTESVATIVNGF